jgi:hypothetical protein
VATAAAGVTAGVAAGLSQALSARAIIKAEHMLAYFMADPLHRGDGDTRRNASAIPI